MAELRIYNKTTGKIAETVTGAVESESTLADGRKRRDVKKDGKLRASVLSDKIATPPPPPVVTPSPDGTIGQKLVDPLLHAWEVTDGKISRDGTVIVPSNNVTEVLLHKGDVYQHAAGDGWDGWWKWVGGLQVWSERLTDPRVDVPPPVEPPPPPPSNAGTLVFDADFNVDRAILPSKWWTHGDGVSINPYDNPGASWFHASRRKIVARDGKYVCRLEAQASGGSFGGASMGAINTHDKFIVQPATPDSPFSCIVDWYLPDQQGAWPAFWLWNRNGNVAEFDFPELFGNRQAVFTVHYAGGGHSEAARVPVPASAFSSKSQFACRFTTSRIYGWLNGQQVCDVPNPFAGVNWDLDVRCQGIAQGGVPEWNWTGVPNGYSGLYYLDVERVRVFRGGTGIPA